MLTEAASTKGDGCTFFGVVSLRCGTVFFIARLVGVVYGVYTNAFLTGSTAGALYAETIVFCTASVGTTGALELTVACGFGNALSIFADLSVGVALNAVTGIRDACSVFTGLS